MIKLDKIKLKTLLEKWDYQIKDLPFDNEYEGGFFSVLPFEGFHIEIAQKSKSKIAIINIFDEKANYILDKINFSPKIGDKFINKEGFKERITTNETIYTKILNNYEITIFANNLKITNIIIEDLKLIEFNASNSLECKNSNLSTELIDGYWKNDQEDLDIDGKHLYKILKISEGQLISASNSLRNNFHFTLTINKVDFPKLFGIKEKIIRETLKKKYKCCIEVIDEYNISIDEETFKRIDEKEFQLLTCYIKKYREENF